MRLVRLKMIDGDVRIVAGWAVTEGETEGEVVVDAAGGAMGLPPVVRVGTCGFIRLSPENPPPVHGGVVWEAHICGSGDGSVPVLEPERHPTSMTLVALDASEVARPAEQSVLMWRPLIGAPRRRFPEFFIDSVDAPGDDIVVDGRAYAPVGGGYAERAIASMGKWEALELIECPEIRMIHEPPRNAWSEDLSASIGDANGAPLPARQERRVGVLLMEAGRRMMYFDGDRWDAWAAANLPRRLRDEAQVCAPA